MQDVMARTNSLLTNSTRTSLADSRIADDWISQMTDSSIKLLNAMCKHSDFLLKYDISSREAGTPMVYVSSVKPSKYYYNWEVFPKLAKTETNPSGKQVEELVYHNLFESVIERFTKTTVKQNPVLRDTRSSEFCYRLAMRVEAVPANKAKKPLRLILLREFLIMQHLWRCYEQEVRTNSCGFDQMIGFPMPFEFVNVVGCADFDLVHDGTTYFYYNINGAEDKFAEANIPSPMPDSNSSQMGSTLSYMSYERLGPSLEYIVDLMRSQGKGLSVSSALKIFDQIICRLLIMHKYAVVHGDPNPTCFFFGPAESCNVLYISEFGSSVVKPGVNRHLSRFHDRFVSHLRFRARGSHFVHDLESAFYILLYMLAGRLPWDSRINGSVAKADVDISVTQIFERHDPYTDRTVTFEDKEKFWQSPEVFNRAFRLIDLEFHDPLYQSFSVDLLQSLYSRTKESLQMSSCSPISYAKECNVANSAAYNIYFGLRRIVAIYFRFESVNPTLKDQQGTVKLEQLNKDNPTDSRIAWDLSHWCWNYLDSRPPGTAKKFSFKA